MSLYDKWKKEDQKEVVDILSDQLGIEGQLVGLYEAYERGTENKALRRVMQMFRLDSQRHINILQAVIEVVEGADVLIDDKKELHESLKKHLELEAEAIRKANEVLGKRMINENQGLKMLLEFWRDDEKRHHKALRELTKKTYYQLSATDMITIFKGEEFLEERYLRSKQFREKMSQTE